MAPADSAPARRDHDNDDDASHRVPPEAVPAVTLIVGGTRSGKSAHGESLIADMMAARDEPEAVYLATCQPGDDAEMQARIQAHKARRGAGWQTVEEPFGLPAALAGMPDHVPVLVDSLSLWLSNLLVAGRDADGPVEALLSVLRHPRGPVVLVADEVGLGIVPDNALARAFRDRAGLLNQKAAALADRVILIAAGLPLTLKSTN